MLQNWKEQWGVPDWNEQWLVVMWEFLLEAGGIMCQITQFEMLGRSLKFCGCILWLLHARRACSFNL